MTEETRRRRGQTYSPIVDLDGGLDDPHHIALYVEVTPDAASLDAVIATVRQTAQAFVDAPPSPETLAQVVRPLLSEFEAVRQTDTYWSLALASPKGWDAARADLIGLGEALGALTPADIHALAGPWLSTPPIIVLSRPDAAPLGGAPQGDAPQGDAQ